MMRKVLGIVVWLLIFGHAMAEPLDKVVAVVNHNVITASELEQQIIQVRQQLDARKVAIPEEKALRKQVLQHLIDEEIQLQLAEANNVTIDGVELDEAIERIAESNHITVEQMRQALQQQGLDYKNYRNSLRKQMIISRVQQNAVGHEIMVSMQQVKDYLKSAEHLEKNPQLYHVQHIVIPLPEEPTPQQVKNAHDKALQVLNKIKHGDDFTRLAILESSGEYALEGGDLGERQLAELPELFANEVVKMKHGQVVGPLRASNGFQLIKLVSTSENNVHHEVTKTHVRHILLKPGVNMTEGEASRQIINLYEQLKSGKDFAIMARQYSLDRASAEQGGDLGWMTSEELVPAFAEVMDALPVNVISKPVKTSFGWHLIQVLERKKEDDSIAYQRQQVQQLLRQRKFAEAVQSWQLHMRSVAFIHVLDKELA
ncbi:MAG: molecular chaperone SurA [Legionella sp. 21-45-4]|nr:MAG: molecular chaperone SurA [Legionella sp. 21-45-4]